MSEQTTIVDPELQTRVRNRYSAELSTLRRIGFEVVAYSLEIEGPYSAVLQLPMLLMMMANREVLIFPRPLRLAVAVVILGYPTPATFGVCMGKGVKLYTGLDDGALLLSSTFRSYAVPLSTSKIIRPAPSASVEAAWQDHGRNVRRLEAEGRRIREMATYDDFLELSRQEEDVSQYE